MVAGEPTFDVCELREALEGSSQTIGCESLRPSGISVDDSVPERFLFDVGEDRPGMPVESVGDSRVVGPAAPATEDILRQLPATDPGHHVDITRDHDKPSGDRYLLAGRAIRQSFSVPELELITECPDQSSSEPELGCHHSRDFAGCRRDRPCLLRPRGEHAGYHSYPLGARQAGAKV